MRRHKAKTPDTSLNTCRWKSQGVTSCVKAGKHLEKNCNTRRIFLPSILLLNSLLPIWQGPSVYMYTYVFLAYHRLCSILLYCLIFLCPKKWETGNSKYIGMEVHSTFKFADSVVKYFNSCYGFNVGFEGRVLVHLVKYGLNKATIAGIGKT